MALNDHIKWLIDTEEHLEIDGGSIIHLYELRYENDDAILSSWAKHFRSHYCSDIEIDLLRNGTGMTRSEFLNNIKFPTAKRGFGPGIRAGDFGEILVADYLEYRLGYWVPRTRYDRKTIRDESTKGSDLIGFKQFDKTASPKDELSIYEVKTQFSGTEPKPRLQDAINDSVKDEIRKAESLNAIKQRLVDQNKFDDVAKIERFQNFVDKPYKDISGAAALFSENFLDRKAICETCAEAHPNKSALALVVIHGKDLMKLVHTLYERAANEA